MGQYATLDGESDSTRMMGMILLYCVLTVGVLILWIIF